MRTGHHSHKRLAKNMEALGLRHRRGHALRRTMISQARTDGAQKDLLELCTNTPPTRGNTIDYYMLRVTVLVRSASHRTTALRVTQWKPPSR
ncbi:hypothetical protein Q664_46870 [Archangium violaceum Cb vi76]|uniref:Uncharacterized protein n=1 Tax=Archangium violaceum Cb vi76 TaxID=1406225 RepID=A0A084SGG9_9BACT|nr:hypothetical protein Q664_46870 [Archangium violaceum Cb vi76]